MTRYLRCSAVSVFAFGLVSTAFAQTQPPPLAPDGGVLAEVRSLKRLVELQTKEINGLAEQVARLRQATEGREAPPEGAPRPPAPPPAAEPAPAAPAPEPPAPAAAETSEAPRAQATGGGVKHLVVKGETLTSIAKHYNVALTELQKANKGLEARKMQIGQMLNIPASATPATPVPETPAPTEKKETP